MAYCTRAEADAYMALSLHAEAWAKASDEQKDAALMTASRRIDMQPLRRSKWAGRADAPQAVKDACVEEALALLSQTPGELKREKWMRQGMAGNIVGDAHEYYQQTVVRDKAVGGVMLLSPEARRLLSRYRVGAVPIV